MFRHYCLWSVDKKIKTPSQTKTVVANETKTETKTNFFSLCFFCFFLDFIWQPFKPGFTQSPECKVAMFHMVSLWHICYSVVTCKVTHIPTYELRAYFMLFQDCHMNNPYIIYLPRWVWTCVLGPPSQCAIYWLGWTLLFWVTASLLLNGMLCSFGWFFKTNLN